MFTSHDYILSSICNVAILNEHAAAHYIDIRITVPVSGTLSVFQIHVTRFPRFTLRLSVLCLESSREVWRHFIEAVSSILNPRTHHPSTCDVVI